VPNLKKINVLHKHTENLDFKDVHQLPNISNVNKENLLKRLHLIKSEGPLLLSLDANIDKLKRGKLKWLPLLISMLPIKFFANLAYIYWAKKRYKKTLQPNLNI